jgi:hypothetical protein
MLNDAKTIPAMIIDGKMYVPVRVIADLLGLYLVYNNESKIAKLYEMIVILKPRRSFNCEYMGFASLIKQ